MFLMLSSQSRRGERGRSKRHRAKLKAKNRRRVNRMAGRRLSAKGTPQRNRFKG